MTSTSSAASHIRDPLGLARISKCVIKHGDDVKLGANSLNADEEECVGCVILSDPGIEGVGGQGQACRRL